MQALAAPSPSRANHLLAVLLTAAGLPLLVACGSSASPYDVPLHPGSPWPKFRANSAQDGRSAIRPSLSGGRFWVFQTGKGIFSSPVVGGDGTIYVGSADRIFYAINPDGTERWRVQTGEIIDSAALLDDKGRVYFGSGDGRLRALDAATGASVWTMEADPPEVNSAFIRWFEGNVAIAPDGTLYVPNDNYFVYAVDRDTGAVKWRFQAPDQTWSLGAVDAQTGHYYFGNNNAFGVSGLSNVFAVNQAGRKVWGDTTLGTVAASPMLTPGGLVVVGSFDGYVRAYDKTTGTKQWELGTRDHVYASAGRLSDGTIVQPSADGTVYAIAPGTGTVRWAFDTPEPIRSSPAIDGDDNIYFGGGDGRLYVLNKDGTLRWSLRLVDDDRNDLNASPALGRDAVYIAGESGGVFSVPYDFCLRPENASDGRCTAGPDEGLPAAGAFLYPTTAFGALQTTPPAEIDPNQPLVFSFVLREGGDSKLAVLDATGVTVALTPTTPVTTEVSGDGKFLTVIPETAFPAGSLTVNVEARYLVNLSRVGLRLSGGTAGGTATASFTTTVRTPESTPFSLTVPTQPGDPSGVWELSRLALPLPTLLPSYNQIGFDSLHYLIGLVEGSGDRAVAWMVGARLDDRSQTVVDPASKALLPLEVSYAGGLVTFRNNDGLKVEVMSATIPFRAFRLSGRLGAQGDMQGPGHLAGSSICGQIPFFGVALRSLGLCNSQTDGLSVYGGVLVRHYGTGTVSAPAGLGAVAWERTASAITASFTGSSLRPSEHLLGILLVDPASGRPVALDYGLQTTRAEGAGGIAATVSLSLTGATVPSPVRAYLMVGTYPAARTELAAP